jgi:hypothetical protein
MEFDMLLASTSIQLKEDEDNPRPEVDYQIFSVGMKNESVKEDCRERQGTESKKRNGKTKKNGP